MQRGVCASAAPSILRPQGVRRLSDSDLDPTLAYRQLHPHEILSAVETLGYVCNGQFLALNSYENRVYRIGIEDAPAVVVKFYRPARWSDAAIREEHAFALQLAAGEIPVVAPLCHGGQTLHTHGPFRFAVYPNRGGRAPDLDNLPFLRQLGRFVARIHAVGDTAEFAHRPSVDLASYGLASREYLLEHRCIPADLETAYTTLCDHLFPEIEACYARAGDVRQLRVHGDFHPSNVLVRDEQMHIVDLDDARRGPAVQDLWMFLSGDREEQTPQLAELLAGYCEFRDFDARELHILEALRALRIMHYAAWLARRWEDPAFQLAFPWFNSQRYWEQHVLALREQVALMQEAPLAWER